jgi:hypothetical protein
MLLMAAWAGVAGTPLSAEVIELKADNEALREQLARWERSANP